MALPPITSADIERIKPKLVQCLDIVRPEAKELVTKCMHGMQTTENGYGTVLAIISSLPTTMQCSMLCAMIEEGYPTWTADSIAEIQGIQTSFHRFQNILHS